MAKPITKKKARVAIREQWCKGCGICVAFCPLKVLNLNEDSKPFVDNDICNGCRLCERLCPDFAIDIGEESDGTAKAEADSGQ